MQRERHQPHAALRVETAHSLHETDVPFLDQIRLRQPIPDVLAANRNDQTQLLQDELPGRVDVVFSL